MPDEHLRLPRNPGEWDPYHRASKEALAEGEFADHWLSDNPTHGIGEYERLAGRQGSRDRKEELQFLDWRNEVERVVANSASIATAEAATFSKIVQAETDNRKFPTIASAALSAAAVSLARLPGTTRIDDLPYRRPLRDRGPWEVAADTLLQHAPAIRPDDEGFAKVLEDARLRARRNAGDLTGAFTAFSRATELAVAKAYNEGPPSATWAASDYKRRADELRTELDKWDVLMRGYDVPDPREMQAQADACANKLVAMALACNPGSDLSNRAAFSSVTGLAMVMAIGERMAAQIASRAGEVTVQGLYDRLIEIPVRNFTDSNSVIGKSFNKGYEKLADVWQKQVKDISGQMKRINVRDEYFKACFGDYTPSIQKSIRGALGNWDKSLKDPSNFRSPQGLMSLRESVTTLSHCLSILRRFIESEEGLDREAYNYQAYRAARGALLETIDNLTDQVQRRLALALKVDV